MTELEPKISGGRGFATSLFAIWGMGGFAIAGFAVLAAPPLSAIPIILLWIGGTVFFGMAALISAVSYRVGKQGIPVYVAAAPPPDDPIP